MDMENAQPGPAIDAPRAGFRLHSPGQPPAHGDHWCWRARSFNISGSKLDKCQKTSGKFTHVTWLCNMVHLLNLWMIYHIEMCVFFHSYVRLLEGMHDPTLLPSWAGTYLWKEPSAACHHFQVPVENWSGKWETQKKHRENDRKIVLPQFGRGFDAALYWGLVQSSSGLPKGIQPVLLLWNLSEIGQLRSISG